MAQLYPENRDKEEFTSEAEFLIYEEFKKNLDKLPSSLKIYHSAVWSKKAYQIKEEKEYLVLTVGIQNLHQSTARVVSFQNHIFLGSYKHF